jgi:hypothetical protein
LRTPGGSHTKQCTPMPWSILVPWKLSWLLIEVTEGLVVRGWSARTLRSCDPRAKLFLDWFRLDFVSCPHRFAFYW